MRHIPRRTDVLPAGEAPKHVQQFLLKLGGRNGYGEPMLRCVLADHIMQQRGGVWYDWPENADLSEQGGIVFSDEKKIVKTIMKAPTGQRFLTEVEMPAEMKVSDQKPVRIVREMRTIQRYPNLKGWMLQTWEPASVYAPRTWWEEKRVPGAEDLMILGPFPERGDYEPFLSWVDLNDPAKPIVVSTWHTMPPLSRIELGYAQFMHSRQEASSANPDWRKLTRMIEWKNQEDDKLRRVRAENAAYLRDKVRPIFASSLAAGRIREELASRARARGVELGHVGN